MTGRVEEFRESIEPGRPLAEARVDGNVVRGVVVHRSQSANGRTYTRRALRDLVELAREGPVQVFQDHDRGAAERSTGDLVGTLRNIRLAGDTVRADLHLLRTAAQIKSIAETEPGLVGLSISARGRIDRTPSGVVVREVTALQSVDVVTRPATAKSLFESDAHDRREEEAKRLLVREGIPEDLVEDVPTLVTFIASAEDPEERRRRARDLARRRRRKQDAMTLQESGVNRMGGRNDLLARPGTRRGRPFRSSDIGWVWEQMFGPGRSQNGDKR